MHKALGAGNPKVSVLSTGSPGARESQTTPKHMAKVAAKMELSAAERHQAKQAAPGWWCECSQGRPPHKMTWRQENAKHEDASSVVPEARKRVPGHGNGNVLGLFQEEEEGQRRTR